MSVLKEYLIDLPIVLWAMDERSGLVFRDLGTAANHAKPENGALLGYPSPNIDASSVLLNGSNQMANRDASIGPINTTGFPVGSLPYGDQAVTMEVWAYPTYAPGGTYGCLLSYGYQNGGGNTHRVFNLAGAGVAASAFSDGVNVGNNIPWSTNFIQNKWQHFAFTYAGLTGALRFYRDGVQDAVSTNLLNTTVSPDRIRAGYRSDDARATSPFAGRLWMAAIYPTALSAARILAHYNAGLRGGVVL